MPKNGQKKRIYYVQVFYTDSQYYKAEGEWQDTGWLETNPMGEDWSL